MPIIDQRRIAFDVSALKDILSYSPQAAKSVGLPGNLADYRVCLSCSDIYKSRPMLGRIEKHNVGIIAWFS
jgi:hypothetical protein